MMLVEDGKLSLDDPVEEIHSGLCRCESRCRYVRRSRPSRRSSCCRAKRSITIKDLLRHTVGHHLRVLTAILARSSTPIPISTRAISTNAEFAERIAKLPLADQPATRWDYGHSTDILGRVVEVASGQTLYPVRAAATVRPARDARDRVFCSGRNQVVADCPAVATYRFDQPAGIKIRDPTLPRRWVSGGGWPCLGPIRDYARFAQMLLNGGTLDGRRYLKAETVALMASDHIGPETGIVHDPFYFPGPTSGFGLVLPCARRRRRIRPGRSANIVGTAPPAASISSIPSTICLRSSWCMPARRVDGFN